MADRPIEIPTFHPPTSPTRLSVRGLNCNNCAQKARAALQSIPGIDSVQVDLNAGSVLVTWSPGVASQPDLAATTLSKAGYPAQVQLPNPAALGSTNSSPSITRPTAWLSQGWNLNLVLAGGGFLILMIGEWALNLGSNPAFRWFSFTTALAVQVLCGKRFYEGAWAQLKTGRSNMDTLVSLGSSAAFLHSAWLLLGGHGGHLFFLEAVGIIGLVSVGHWLESRMSAQAEGTLRGLLSLAPDQATKVNLLNGTESKVPSSSLRPQHIIVLKPGDRIAADGRVVQGQSSTDESMLTGESMPVEKQEGATVYRGTLNLDGRLVVRVTASAEQSALARIADTVQRAQGSRASIQRLGDRVSSVFVPCVVLIAFLAGAGWIFAPSSLLNLHHALQPFLWHGMIFESSTSTGIVIFASILIVACPCAMGLATPVAIMAATNAAARRGILIRDGIALEKAGQITSILFDKTGTLTQGSATVVATHPNTTPPIALAPNSVSYIETLAGSLASASAHPLSQAVARWQPARLPLDGFKESRGQGIQAVLRPSSPSSPFVDSASESTTQDQPQVPIRLGSVDWHHSLGIDTSRAHAFQSEWIDKGATVLLLSQGQDLLLAIALTDRVKAGTHDMIQAIRRSGLEAHMITGDHRRTALAIARECGIPEQNVHASASPEEKVRVIAALQEKGARVAFVGDGINDAPALRQSNLGIAVTQACDIARESADILLLRSDIQALPQALDLANRTLRVIKQNLFWAFFYNAAAVPLAALGFMSPLVCALSMGLSDIIVVGNSLRILRSTTPPSTALTPLETKSA